MCGIVGFFNIENADKLMIHALEILTSRGKDGVGIAGTNWLQHGFSINELSIPSDDNILGHTLHSIVNFTPQPIVYNGTFVSNCEIYNWKDLSSQFKIDATNDADLLMQLIDTRIKRITHLQEIFEIIDTTLNLVRGVYALAYWKNDTVYIVRDIIGLKPIWYSLSQGFAFASEKKALNKKQFKDIQELNPREIISYNITSNEINRYVRQFFTTTPEHTGDLKHTSLELQRILEDAINIRFPDEPFGILFSGGLDSTILVLMCKHFGKIPGKDFICYTAGLKSVNAATDVAYAKEVAAKFGLDLVIHEITFNEVEEYLTTIVPLLEEANVPKVGVALTLYVACEAAKSDGLRVMFSGSGADELFAGYNRYKHSTNVNKDCYADILKIYEKNTYRDDVICMYNNIEVRAPYLDIKFVDYSLKIPPKYKINTFENKVILRELAKNIGLCKKFAHRKKQAAQYGSKFDGAINKLARKNYKTKTEYLKQFYTSANAKLGVLFSSGKDSNYAMYIMLQQNYSIKCLITIKSVNPDSYMFHTPNIGLAQLQAQALSLPLIEHTTQGEKEKELQDLKNAILEAKNNYGIEGIITGALYSNYQRERIEKICDSLGIKVFSPLWHIDQEKEMRQLLNLNFKFIFSSVAAYGLNSKWVGHVITKEDVDKLVILNQKIGINIAGEGGEFESFVLDAPMYKKRIEIVSSEIEELDEYTARLNITNAILVEKTSDLRQ